MQKERFPVSGDPVGADGKVGHYKGQAAITNMKDGKETADTHGIAIRTTR
jgi:hypothetical protein